MKTHHVLILGGGILLVFALGLGAGMWFSQHYRIVPLGESSPPSQSAFQPVAPPAAPAPQILPAASLGPAVEPPLEAAPAPYAGLFAYHFTPGEALKYRLATDIQGTGFDLGQGANIGLKFLSSMILTTEGVYSSGTGALRLDFTSVDMTGDFMGSPVVLHKGPGSSKFQMGSRTEVDSSAGLNLGMIPQLDFFGQPIRMTVAPNGDIVNVSGAEGFDKLLTPITRLSPPPSGETGLQPNTQWESQFSMPIPGLADGVNSVARNTFTGYTEIDGRQCGVVRQEILSHQSQGTLSALGGVAGQLGLPMPLLNLAGTNLIYFDTVSGKLVRCDLDLNFNLEIGAPLGALTQALRMFNDALGEAGGAKPSPAPELPGNQNMGARITGSLSLVE